MENPSARLHPLPNTRSRTARYIGTAFVGVVHVIAIWALVNGLAGRIVQSVPKFIEAKIVQTPPPKETPPPQPQVKLQAPPKVVQAYVPPPDIKVATPPPPAPVVQQVQRTVPPPVVAPPPRPVAPPAPPPVPAIPDSGPVGITSTHTIPPYPPMALRLGKEGTTTLRISVSASGTITDATVIGSSGSDDLDQVAIQWVKEHWQYKPAIRNGQPAAGTVQAAVRFTLKNAR
ncbi:MAG TPA: energy transducer TonB [Rhizomicrobium sp.]|jgi:protein TonB|nr:energy transducer TonB [Rhizomicrobium sp.]